MTERSAGLQQAASGRCQPLPAASQRQWLSKLLRAAGVGRATLRWIPAPTARLARRPGGIVEGEHRLLLECEPANFFRRTPPPSAIEPSGFAERQDAVWTHEVYFCFDGRPTSALSTDVACIWPALSARIKCSMPGYHSAGSSYRILVDQVYPPASNTCRLARGNRRIAPGANLMRVSRRLHAR